MTWWASQALQPNSPEQYIHERLLSARSGRSWIRRQWNDDVSLSDRYRLLAALQLFEKLCPPSAAIRQKQPFKSACNCELMAKPPVLDRAISTKWWLYCVSGNMPRQLWGD